MIDKKWKWVAKDADDGIYLFQRRPIIIGTKWSDAKEASYYVDSDLWTLHSAWKDSLHEIIHHEDGKIEFRKARPELKVDDPVLVREDPNDDWVPRHFCEWTTDGRVRAYPHGTTSFTAKDGGFDSPTTWEEYKLP